MEIALLEARLKHVTDQRDRAWKRIKWFCNLLSQTRLSIYQQEIKKKIELEIEIERYQANYEISQDISEADQYKKLKTYPAKGKLIG
jgi:predicted FMN-binding regulatory protein PaiB